MTVGHRRLLYSREADRCVHCQFSGTGRVQQNEFSQRRRNTKVGVKSLDIRSQSQYLKLNYPSFEIKFSKY